MSYSQFSLREVKRRLDLRILEGQRLFDPAALSCPTPSDYLRTTLEEFAPLALSINTEKSRSEWIVAPILAELRRHFDNTISLFSGTRFNVDEGLGLDGQCDFLVSLDPEQFYIVAPVLAVVEAKKEDLVQGLGQCIATMYAAQLYNRREDRPIQHNIWGAVTTGSIWKFLRLAEDEVLIDREEYYLKEVQTLLAILIEIVKGAREVRGTEPDQQT